MTAMQTQQQLHQNQYDESPRDFSYHQQTNDQPRYRHIINILLMAQSPQDHSIESIKKLTNSHPQLLEINEKIQSNILQGKISIPKQSVPLIADSVYIKRRRYKSTKQLINTIRANQKKTLATLQQLVDEQKVMKCQISKYRQECKSKSNHKSLSRSSFTEQEKLEIKAILKRQRSLQKLKTEQHERILSSFREKQFQLRFKEKEKILQMKKQHHYIAQHNYMTLEMKKKVRTQTNQSVSSRASELKNKRYLFIENQKIDKKLEIQREKEAQKRLQELKQKFKFDSQEINEHFHNHKITSQRNRERLEQRLKMERKINNRVYKKHYFSLLIEQQEKKKQEMEEMKANRYRLQQEKVQEFNRKVMREHKPRLSESRSLSQSNSESKTEVRLSVPHEQRCKMGNQYLRIAKQRRVDKNLQVITEPVITTPRYKDYLKSIKTNNRVKTSSHRFREIINAEPSICNYESARKIANLAEQIQSRSKKNKDEKLIESIKNKLDILNKFSNI